MSMVLSVRRAPLLGILLPLFALLLTSLSSCTQGMDIDALAKINATRAELGAQTLSRDAQLDKGAQAKANELAQTGQLVHSQNPAAGVAANWTVFGENLGKGSSVDQVYQLWLASPTHKSTMTDARFNYAGVGVAETPEGTLFFVVHFMAA